MSDVGGALPSPKAAAGRPTRLRREAATARSRRSAMCGSARRRTGRSPKSRANEWSRVSHASGVGRRGPRERACRGGRRGEAPRNKTRANEWSRVSHASGAGRRGPRERACRGGRRGEAPRNKTRANEWSRVQPRERSGAPGSPRAEACQGGSGGAKPPPDRDVARPTGFRTCGLWLRRPTLYPAELRAHNQEMHGITPERNGGRNRRRASRCRRACRPPAPRRWRRRWPPGLPDPVPPDHDDERVHDHRHPADRDRLRRRRRSPAIARSVRGRGLIFAQFVTLYLTPAFYTYMDALLRWRRGGQPRPV